jgi:alkylhydroperoxidase/carboxymuconolactone decarboxylase family protein YurZ
MIVRPPRTAAFSRKEKDMPYDPLEALGRIDPEMLKRLREQNEFVYADGALPRKVKLLIAMAFDAAHGAENGVRSLAGQARKAGASTQEIAEALRVSCHLAGVGALYTASAGLKEAQ